jgi:hypothetical protein
MQESEWYEQKKIKREQRRAHDRSWYQAVGGAMGSGILAMAILSQNRQMFAYALFIAIAATLVGAFAGFIFGIPKTVAVPKAVALNTEGNAKNNVLTNNTNLEEISDWLTKILVGAGLVELNTIFLKLQTFGSWFMSKDRPLGQAGWIVAPAIVIAYSVCGFLLAYLWARIYMKEELEPTPIPETTTPPDKTPPVPPATTPPPPDALVPPPPEATAPQLPQSTIPPLSPPTTPPPPDTMVPPPNTSAPPAPDASVLLPSDSSLQAPPDTTVPPPDTSPPLPPEVATPPAPETESTEVPEAPDIGDRAVGEDQAAGSRGTE